MSDLMKAFEGVSLAYISLLAGVVASSMLYVVVLYQVQKLRCAVVFHKQRVDGLERQLSATGGGDAPARRVEPAAQVAAEPVAPQATQRKVLHLHNLGRSSEEIAREAGIREAEVDFVLKVSEHVEAAGGDLALRKIS